MTRSSLWPLAAVILMCFALSLVLWHRLDTRPPAWDETVHLQLASDYRDFIAQGTDIQTRWTAIYPPLYHFSLIPAMSLGQASVLKAVLTHVAYLALLLWALTAFARGHGGSPWIGLLAGLCFIAMPTVLWAERRPLIDFALTAWIAGGMEWLRRSDCLRNRRAVLIWGVWSGLGMLMKPFYPLWFVGPVLLCLWQARVTGERAVPWKNFWLSMALIVLVALPYYGWQGIEFFSNAAQLATEQGATEGDPGFRSLAGWAYYLYAIGTQAGAVLTLLIAAGCLATFLQWRRTGSAPTSGRLWLLAWIVSGYVMFTFNHNKDLRYTMPLLPPLLMLALWSGSYWLQQRRIAFTALSACLGLFVWNAWRIDPPATQDWQLDKIADLMVTAHDRKQPFLLAAMVSNHPHFFSRNLTWSMRRRALSMNSSSIGNGDANFSEFIILKSGDLGPGDDASVRDALLASGRAFSDYYPEIAALPLPDGSIASLHRRDPEHVFQVGRVHQTELEQKLHDSVSKLIAGPMTLIITGTPDEWQRGLIRSVRISGGPWTVRGIPIAQGNLELRDAQFNLYQLWDHGTLGLVSFAALTPELTFDANQLASYLQKKAKHTKNAALRFDAGQLLISADYYGISTAVDLALKVSARPHLLTATLDSLRIGYLPLPGWLLGKIHQQKVALEPIASFPGRINIGSIQTEGDILRIVGEPAR